MAPNVLLIVLIGLVLAVSLVTMAMYLYRYRHTGKDQEDLRVICLASMLCATVAYLFGGLYSRDIRVLAEDGSEFIICEYRNGMGLKSYGARRVEALVPKSEAQDTGKEMTWTQRKR